MIDFSTLQGLTIPVMTKRVKLTNLVPDGSFEDAANNWNCWLAEPTDTSQAKDGTHSLKLGGDALAATKTAVVPINGHKYYGREYIKTAGQLDAADCRFEMCGAVNGAEKAFVFGWNRGNYPNWTIISDVIAVDGSYTDGFGIRTFTVGGTVSAWVDSIVVIDLTETCGVGNEPSKEWCDANIPFFSGSYTLDIPLSSPVQAAVTQIADASGRVLWSANKTVNVLYLRPSADIDIHHSLYPAESSAAYLLINEEVGDGLLTYVYDSLPAGGSLEDKTSKFALSCESSPKGGTITSGKVSIYYLTSYANAVKYSAELIIDGTSTGFYTMQQEANEFRLWSLPLNPWINTINDYLATNKKLPTISVAINTKGSCSSTKGESYVGFSQLYIELNGEFIV